jgi:hypothetical protein
VRHQARRSFFGRGAVAGSRTIEVRELTTALRDVLMTALTFAATIR